PARQQRRGGRRLPPVRRSRPRVSHDPGAHRRWRGLADRRGARRPRALQPGRWSGDARQPAHEVDGPRGLPPRTDRHSAPRDRQAGRDSITRDSNFALGAPYNRRMLRIESVSKRFRSGNYGVRDDSLTARGGVLALLGPNGAGKTTLMQMIATVTKP